MSLLLISVIASTCGFAADSMTKDPSTIQFLSLVEARSNLAIAYLSKGNVWRPDNRERLLNNLRVIQLTRSPKALPLLVQHMAFRDSILIDNNPFHMYPLHVEYPVCWVLQSYGSSAVPALLSRLSQTGEYDSKSVYAKEVRLVASLLTNLSDDWETGTTLARSLVLKELTYFKQIAPEQNFPYLHALLNHRRLQPIEE